MMRAFLIATLLLGMAPVVSGTPLDAAAPKQHAARPVAARPASRPNWVQTVVRTPEGGYRMGNPNARIALIEYGSRTCPHCALFDAQGVPALTSKYVANGQLSYEFRDFPIHGVLDMGPILLGQCVSPAQFFPMLNRMMAAQKQLLKRAEIPAADQEKLRTMTPGPLIAWLANYYGYTALVAQHGVPAARAQACLADPRALAAVAKQTDTANSKYAIQGTPTFIVNGKVAPNTYDWATLEPTLRAAGAK
jgi:protein-disulfide isomerase